MDIPEILDKGIENGCSSYCEGHHDDKVGEKGEYTKDNVSPFSKSSLDNL